MISLTDLKNMPDHLADKALEQMQKSDISFVWILMVFVAGAIFGSVLTTWVS